MTDSKSPIDKSTEDIHDREKISVRLIQEIRKTREQIDICIKITNNSSISFTIEILVNTIKEIKKNRKIKSRCIIDNTKENTNYLKKLIPLLDEIRYSDIIETSFFINEVTYTNIHVVQRTKSQQRLSPQRIVNNVKSFVKQQKILFDLLWDRSTLEYQYINENGIGTTQNGKEILHPITLNQSIAKTKVLENQQDIFKVAVDFYQNSNHLKFCSPIEAIKIINNNFLNFHQEILERYRQGNHKGIRWITSLNNKKDIELVKSYIEKGIEVRHIKELLTNSFSLSDKAFLFPIGKIEEKGTREHSILISNDKSYLSYYDDLFENLWKKGIDIHTRLNDIEEGHHIEIDVISNPKESINLIAEKINFAKKEILLILSSINSIDRIESNNHFDILQRLTFKRIKIRVIIPSNSKLQYKIYELQSKYPNIEFRGFHATYDPFIGITVIDKEKVLINEVKDDSKKDYPSSIGLTIFIEGKSAALSYVSIFNSLWRQTKIYEEIKKAYEKVENHDKMQKEFIEIASHELRTPIHPMLGFIEILRNKITDKEQLGFIEIIYRNTMRLKKLSEDILEVSKVENKLFNLKKEHFNIKDLIQNLMINYKKQVVIKNIEFEFEHNTVNDFVIYADKEKIIQVITNLINNSIKFIPNGKRGKISITVEKRAKYKDDNNGHDVNDISNPITVITIKDNGSGIDADILPILFKKFASKSFHGTGLGLYICKKIVEAHGGVIRADNNRDKKGATFMFSLPFDKK
ncbi:MAG: sensor histidine kinase [Candidatus Nitrosocosmicus sp.]